MNDSIEFPINSSSNEIDPKEYSRRDVLKFALLGIAGGFTGWTAAVPVPAVIEQQKVLKENQNITNEQYILENKEWLKNVEIGGSFIVESYNNNTIALEELKRIVEDWNIKKLRLSVRWENVIDKNTGEFNFYYYNEIFNYCVENNVEVCLNVGIKTMGYPEIHLPQFIIDKSASDPTNFPIPVNLSVIEENDYIAQEAISYYKNLFDYLKITFGDSLNSVLKVIQPENESFDPAGERKWTMSKDYLKKCIILCHDYFPSADILLNTAAVKPPFISTMDEVKEFIINLNNEKKEFKNKLRLGFDYYHLRPGVIGIGNLRTDTITSVKLIEGLNVFDSLTKDAVNNSFKLEVTEAQGEKWNPYNTPGNSVGHLKFVLERCARNFMVPGDNLLIRYWGLERLTKIFRFGEFEGQKLNDEHRKIVDLIQKINIYS